MKFQLVSSKPRIFRSTSSPSTDWKFSFWVLSDMLLNATCPSILVTAAFPKRTLLLALTTAPAPIAVALVKSLADTLARDPMAVFWLPVVLIVSAKTPMAVLLSPVVLLLSALTPLAVLERPVVLSLSALAPLAVFK